MRTPLLAWAARDLLRRPWESLLLAAALGALVALSGSALLLGEALADTAERVLGEGPSLVVRRAGPTGWAPLPIAEGIAAAEAVPGVVSARPRLWGVVGGPSGPLTAVGVLDPAAGPLLPAEVGPGQAVVGPGIPAGDDLTLMGAAALELRVVGRLEPGAALVAHDLVLLDAADARRLLAVPVGHASDLALDVFHVAEEEAILPDLARAFPWPVQVTTRRDALGAYTGGLARRGGIALLVAVPSLLAVVLLALVAVRDRASRRWEVGLLKACGWTTGDVLRFQALRALAIGIPASVLGLATAYGLVLWPGTTWPGSWLLGWDGPPPPLHLSGGSAALLLVEVTALAVCPWLVATLASALYAAATDPQAALEARA